MIGLLSPFRVANYGTKLQAYAVQECIRGLGYDVQIIDFEYAHINTTPFNVFHKIIYKIATRNYADSKNNNNCPKSIEDLRKQRIECINHFDSHYILSPKVVGQEAMEELGKQYSTVLCGSDQIWNPVNAGSNIFLLEWVPKGTRKVSFAASFGINKIPALLKPKYKRELVKFNAISVREDSAQKMVNDLGLKAEWILDPTLIVDKTIWEKLANESKYRVPENYVFCYFLGDGLLSRDVVREIKKNDSEVKIVALSHFKGYNHTDDDFADLDLYDVGVEDFVKLIKHAKYVCTDSFHATAFSIIFEKQFFVCNRHGEGRESTNSRLHSFLNSIGANNRICSSVNNVSNVFSKSIDYGLLNHSISIRKKKSLSFLRKNVIDLSIDSQIRGV